MPKKKKTGDHELAKAVSAFIDLPISQIKQVIAALRKLKRLNDVNPI